MATYLFDTMDASTAAAFTTDDSLFFLTGGPSQIGVEYSEGGGLLKKPASGRGQENDSGDAWRRRRKE